MQIMTTEELEKLQQDFYDRGRTAGVNLVWQQSREEIANLRKEFEEKEAEKDRDFNYKINWFQQEVDELEEAIGYYIEELKRHVYLGLDPEKTISISASQVRQVIWDSLSSKWPNGGPTKIDCSHAQYLVPPIRWLENFWAALPRSPVYEIGKFDCSRMIDSIVYRMHRAGNGEFPIGKLIVELPNAHRDWDAMAITIGFSEDEKFKAVFGVWENNFYAEAYRPPKNKVFFELSSGVIVKEVMV